MRPNIEHDHQIRIGKSELKQLREEGQLEQFGVGDGHYVSIWITPEAESLIKESDNE